MAVSYKKLFHLLVDRDMTAAQLQQQAGYSANITSRLRKNIYIVGIRGKDMPGFGLQNRRYCGVHPGRRRIGG